MSRMIEIRNAAGGITNRERVNPQVDARVFSIIDGWDIDSGALVPARSPGSIGGDTFVSTGKGHSPVIVPRGSERNLIVHDRSTDWIATCPATGSEVSSLCEFDGGLFRCFGATSSYDVQIYRAGLWFGAGGYGTGCYTAHAKMNAMCEYLGELFGGRAGLLLKYPGKASSATDWTTVHALTGGAEVPTAMCVYQGKLWVVTDAGTCYYWDSADLTEVTPWTPGGGITPSGSNYCKTLAVFNGKMYLGWSGTPDITSFDGTTWAGVVCGPPPCAAGSVPVLLATATTIYAAFKRTTPYASIVASSTNGTTWTTFFAGDALYTDPGDLCVFDGDLWISDRLSTHVWRATPGYEQEEITGSIKPAKLLEFEDKLWAGASDSGYVYASRHPVIRMVDAAAASPLWATIPGLAARELADATSRMVPFGEQMIVPCLDGLRRFEPTLLSADAWATGTYYAVGDVVQNQETIDKIVPGRGWYQCFTAHIAGATTEPATGADWSLKWRQINAFPLVSIDAPPIAPTVTVGRMTAIDVEDCDHDWDDAAKGAGVTTAIVTAQITEGIGALQVTLASVADSVSCCTVNTATTLNLENKYVLADIYLMGAVNLVATTPYEDCGLALYFYTDVAGGGSLAGHLYIPELSPGWNRVWCKLEADAGVTVVKSIKLITSHWAHPSTTAQIIIDNIRAGVVADMGTWDADNLTGAPECGKAFPLIDYSYAVCFAGPSRRVGTPVKWIISNPSVYASTGAYVGPGDKATIHCNYGDADSNARTWDARWDNDTTHVLFYRSASGGPYVYAGSAIMAPSIDMSFDSDVDYVDTGAIGAFNESLLLPLYMEFNHDVAPVCKHVLASASELFGLCLGRSDGEWARPTSLAIATLERPWYWPTANAYAASTDGIEFESFAIAGTKGMAMVAWRDLKLAFLDSELWLISGPDNGSRQMVYVAPAPIDSERTIATGTEGVVWKGPDSFYVFAGGVPVKVSTSGLDIQIDTQSIDFSEPHDAVLFNGKYYLYCCYGTRPTPATSQSYLASTLLPELMPKWSRTATYLTGQYIEHFENGRPMIYWAKSAVSAGIEPPNGTYWTCAKATAFRSLLIYDLRLGSWMVRSCPYMLGLCKTPDGSDFYGVGYPYGVISESGPVLMDMMNDGIPQVRCRVKTASLELAPLGHDVGIQNAMIDIACGTGSAWTFDVIVSANGKTGVHSQTIRVKPATAGAYNYELPLAAMQGVDASIEVRSVASCLLPTIYGMGLHLGGKVSR